MKNVNNEGKRIGKHKILKYVLFGLAVIVLLGAGGIYFYLSDYSRASEEALEVMASSAVLVTEYDGGVAFGDPQAEKGFIFYPGGKVEYTAYAPLMEAVAEGNVFCVIPQMPVNLAVFDSDAAEDVMEQYPEVKYWFIGGHSLGGAMAADYAGKNPDRVAGLILLAAYAASDISDSDFGVLSIYGSDDGVLNMEKYNSNRSFLPADYTEICIDGGNHAQFGDYGIQEGDNKATITPEEQRMITVEEILTFIYSVH